MSSVIGFRDTWPFGYRLYNVAVATLLLVALSPTILLLAFLLLITQGPNILYFGPRMGKNQRPFQIIKFRTLCPKRARAITADRTLPADANIETRLGKPWCMEVGACLVSGRRTADAAPRVLP